MNIAPQDESIVKAFIERMYFRKEVGKPTFRCTNRVTAFLDKLEYTHLTHSKRWRVVYISDPCRQILPEHSIPLTKCADMLSWLLALCPVSAMPSLTITEIRILSRAGIRLEINNL